jgi:hypothetical protein
MLFSAKNLRHKKNLLKKEKEKVSLELLVQKKSEEKFA